MAVNTINKVDKVQTTTSVDAYKIEKQRLDIDKITTSYDVTSTDLSGFTSSLDPDTQAQINAYYASLPEEMQEAAIAGSLKLGEDILNGNFVVTNLSSLTASEQTKYVLGPVSDAQTVGTQNAILCALGGMESWLRGFAEDVSANTELSRELRNCYTELADMIANWGDDPEAEQEFTWTEVTYDEDGNRQVTTRTEMLNKAGAEALLAELDTMKQNVSDMTELKKFDLQAKYQDYSLAVNTITNMMKQDNDDKMKLISNIKA
ncbi:MAG: hypothetical protein JW841_08635 [Deltaproteobacteria bacterium]|nr:hypothetical protein [Deltaproteobacteria bacterium]